MNENNGKWIQVLSITLFHHILYCPLSRKECSTFITFTSSFPVGCALIGFGNICKHKSLSKILPNRWNILWRTAPGTYQDAECLCISVFCSRSLLSWSVFHRPDTSLSQFYKEYLPARVFRSSRAIYGRSANVWYICGLMTIDLL